MRLAVPPLTAILVLGTFWVQLANGLNADVAWLLTVGERMLDGQRLYTDILELNPPMSALLYLPMVALGRWLEIPPEPLVVAAVLLSSLACLGFCLRILKGAGIVEDVALWWAIGIGALAVFPGGNFGEREHIGVILLLPVLAVAAVRQQGHRPAFWVSLVAGIAAGLVMTIKPHFALPILLVALHGGVSAGSWRPIINLTHVVGGMVLFCYGLVIWLIFPDFVSDMLPLAADAYVGDRRGLVPLLVGFPTLPFWIMLAGLVLVYRREAFAAPSVQFVLASISFFLVYLVQGKGFAYHLLPANVLLVVVFTQCFIARNGRGHRRPLFLALATLALSFPSVVLLRGDAVRSDLLAALRPMGTGLAIANMTAHLDVASPLHRQLGADLVNSGPCLWITLGAVRRAIATDDQNLQQRMKALESFERERLAADLTANPPDIILAGADRFDWIGWARQDQSLAALLDDYELLKAVGPDAVSIQIWQRRSS